MRLSRLAVGILALALATACTSTDNGGGGTGGSVSGSGGSGSGGSGSGGSGTGGTGSGGTGSGGSGTGGSGSGGSAADMGSSGGVTYADVKPIFVEKCGACHVTGKQGQLFHTLAEKADDAMKPASSCPGKTKGACTLDRIKAGTMPSITPKCTGNPAMDTANAKCLTQAEQDKIKAWIDGGLK